MSPERATPSEHPRSRSIIRRRLRLALRAITVQTFSSLTRRIVVLNLAGLVALVVGIFYLNQFREGLIDARVQALLTQGEIMASAVAASASVETGSIRIDPEKLLEQQAAGEDESDDASSLDFPINPEKVAPLMRRLISPTKLRARVYDRDGNLVIDSRALFIYSDIVRTDLPQPKQEQNLAERVWNTVKRYLFRSDAPLYKEVEGAVRA